MPLQERNDLLPQQRRWAGAVARTVVGEEGVPGPVVDVDFDLLATGTGPLAQLRSELRRGVLILGAYRRQQRAAELPRELQRRRRPLGRGALLRCGLVDEPAPAVDRC